MRQIPLTDHLGVKKGETVLIFGASGAVGTLAVQFARRLGARVIAAVRGRDAARLVKELGADATWTIAKDVAPLKALAPHGLDAVLALAGGEALEAALDCLNARARIAYPNGVEPEPRKRPRVRLISYDAQVGRQHWANLARATEEAKLEVPLAAVVPLARAAKAHQRIEKGHVLGRVVLRIRPGNG
jgi:NADPH:quinone reductase-like Zn-dependent oxidoreductase